MKTMESVFLLLVCMSILITCSSPKKIFERGKYDSLIELLDYKAKKGALSEEEVPILLQSINISLNQKQTELSIKLSSNNGEDWIEGYKSLDDLDEAQLEYSNFKQLDQRQIQWVDIRDWDKKFGDVLYDYHYTVYQDLSAEYEATKNKNYLIDAYYELDKMAHFDKSLINLDSLKSVVKNGAIRKVEIDFQDESSNLYELRHLKFHLEPEDTEWSKFGTYSNEDFKVLVNLINLEKDENKSQRQVEYANNIINSVEEEFDPLGNVVEVPISELVFALVNEVQYQYTAKAEVRVEIFLHDSDQLLRQEFFRAESISQELEYYMLDGSVRAIPPDIQVKSGTPPDSTSYYNYDLLIEEALEIISEDIENYLEAF